LRAAEIDRAAHAARADAEAEKAAAETKRAEAEAARAREEIKRRRTSLALAASVLLLARSEQLVYASKLMLAQNDFDAGNGGLAQFYLDECQSSLRGWEYRYLRTRTQSKQTLVGHTDEVRSAAFSPDGKRVVTASLDGTAKVWDTETGQEVLTLRAQTQYVLGVAFSPDGKRIVTGSAGASATATVWYAESAPKDNLWPLTYMEPQTYGFP